MEDFLSRVDHCLCHRWWNQLPLHRLFSLLDAHLLLHSKILSWHSPLHWTLGCMHYILLARNSISNSNWQLMIMKLSPFLLDNLAWSLVFLSWPDHSLFICREGLVLTLSIPPSGNPLGLKKSLGHQGWISQYLPRFGGARIQSLVSSGQVFLLEDFHPCKIVCERRKLYVFHMFGVTNLKYEISSR